MARTTTRAYSKINCSTFQLTCESPNGNNKQLWYTKVSYVNNSFFMCAVINTDSETVWPETT